MTKVDRRSALAIALAAGSAAMVKPAAAQTTDHKYTIVRQGGRNHADHRPEGLRTGATSTFGPARLLLVRGLLCLREDKDFERTHPRSGGRFGSWAERLVMSKCSPHYL